jgi:transposase
MAYRIAGIDVHKKMLAVVIADVAAEGEYRFERRRFGSGPQELRTLSGWLAEQQVEEVVMESTAQYWKPVWNTLQRYWQPMCGQPAGAGTKMGKLHLAQAQSNRGAQGRKRDFPDAERLVRRLVSQELVLSFVPDAEQRLWRTLMRRKYQLTRSRVQLHNRLESLLEETQIKLSSLVSDLLGVSGRRILRALAEGCCDPAAFGRLGGSTSACDRRTTARCTGARSRIERDLSSSGEDGSGRTGNDRATEDPNGAGDGYAAQPVSGYGATAGGSARFGSGFGPADLG